jgi:hypothetical protein
MITTTSEINVREEEQADIVIVRYEPGVETPGKFAQFMRRPLKVFGFLSTAAWTVAALTPNTFNVPPNFRPWVFVTFIFWFFGYCAGLFNL